MVLRVAGEAQGGLPMGRHRRAGWVATLALAACAWAGHAVHAATLVVITPHPDDAEASCGGLIANSTAAGDRVVILSLTGGELGIPGKSPAEARAIREAESRRGAAVLGASVEFFGAIDGSLAVDSATAARLGEQLARIGPDVVLAPWPLDVHADHQAAGMLAWRVFLERARSFDLWFYETSMPPHTTSFRFQPDAWIDISQAMATKQRATLEHASQHPAEWFETYRALARFRGLEADVPLAEGYVRARPSGAMGGRDARAVTRLP